MVARTGRLTTNGLTRVQNEEKMEKLKVDKDKKNKVKRENEEDMDQHEEAALDEVQKLFEEE